MKKRTSEKKHPLSINIYYDLPSYALVTVELIATEFIEEEEDISN